MIDLYTAATPNGWKASVMLEEVGVAYTAHSVDLSNGEQKRPEFLKINPNGRIPAIVGREAGVTRDSPFASGGSSLPVFFAR